MRVHLEGLSDIHGQKIHNDLDPDKMTAAKDVTLVKK